MMMVRYGLLALFSLVLLACGHGFEGTYTSTAGSSNEFLNEFAGMAAGETIVIGDDFIESRGERTVFDAIFLRESGGERYLVFESDGEEEAWRVVDDHTLRKGGDFINLTLTRVEE
ncbi:hypothetical protein I6N98_18280 [Spongiibacter nanhainus]|uniref:Uncharacterized protein n=1 Tax=Spongiibacter nanhainus TaxID=2794344 RepID=A0A7T4R0N4_9GAMM|nr:hypothetical protein [Spongiibacter nanhainus]QQD18255.1 hypothetical protein I6N98_18280 [Spongiibacter nanhainus]